MTVRVRLYEGGAEWDSYVASNPASTHYHQIGWKGVIERSFGHKGYYLAATTGAGDICGVLPLVHMKSRAFGNFLVSLPFVNYGGLLACEPGAGAALLARACEVVGEMGAEYLEMRHRDFLERLETRQHKVTMILDLQQNEESQWKALDAKVRNQVRKARKSGLSTVTGGSDLLDGFYEVFCRNMRDLGTPVYSKDFFRNILEAFPEAAGIVSVVLEGRTVASGLMIWFRETLEVPWASSISDYREMCPNNLLYWEAMRFAIGRGIAKFDFGRSTPGEGTFRFKKQWGAKPVQLYWQYLLGQGMSIPQLNPTNPKYRLAIRIWQRLPLAVTNALGPRIVRGIP